MKESEILEYKESLTQLKKAVISIVAILNKHKKGKIIFGIKDDGKVIGVSIGKTTLRNISKTISENIEPKIYPEIKEEKIEDKKCISISFLGDNIPYFAYGRAYKRVSDEDRLLTKAELEKMFFSYKKIVWDCNINNDFTLNDISDNKLKKYVKKIGLEYSSKKEVLEKLELLKKGKLTNASIILFGKNIIKHFRLLNLRCAVFLGNDKSSSFVDMKDFNGDLFELIEFAQQYILQHINVGMKLNGLERVDVPEISLDAIREAIINAFCHRDYSINQEVQIAIFKNRVEILSPGRLIEGLKIKDILSKKISKRRNELIADIFHRIHYIEKWGTGIGKIKDLEPHTKFEEFSDFFMVTFKRKDIEKSSEKGSEKSSEKILHLMKENHKITIKELSEKINISTRAIEKNIEKLKQEGKIVRVGSDKSGYWEVK